MLLVLVTAAGREEPMSWPPVLKPVLEEPQVFSIKVVPSPFLIVTWSNLHVEEDSTANAVNSIATISPSSTSMISNFLRFTGYLLG